MVSDLAERVRAECEKRLKRLTGIVWDSRLAGLLERHVKPPRRILADTTERRARAIVEDLRRVEREARRFVEGLGDEQQFDSDSPCARYLSHWGVTASNGRRLGTMRPNALNIATDAAMPDPLPQGIEESERSRLAAQLTRGKDLLRIRRAATPLELGLVWLLLRGIEQVPAARKKDGIQAIIESERIAMKQATKRHGPRRGDTATSKAVSPRAPRRGVK